MEAGNFIYPYFESIIVAVPVIGCASRKGLQNFSFMYRAV